MVAFIQTRFYDLPEDADIQAAYEEFEKDMERAEIEKFAFDNGLDYEIVNDMAINTEKSQQQAAELSSQLWSIANDLRGGRDANEFRNYILGTIFYK